MRVRIGRIYIGGWGMLLLAPFLMIAAPFFLIAKLFKRKPRYRAPVHYGPIPERHGEGIERLAGKAVRAIKDRKDPNIPERPERPELEASAPARPDLDQGQAVTKVDVTTEGCRRAMRSPDERQALVREARDLARISGRTRLGSWTASDGSLSVEPRSNGSTRR